MADMTLYEDRNYYYIRIKDYDKMDADAQVTIPFDEDLSVLVGLLEGDESHRIHYIGANLTKDGFTAEEAENFIKQIEPARPWKKCIVSPKRKKTSSFHPSKHAWNSPPIMTWRGTCSC